jgi:hypothetical protein
MPGTLTGRRIEYRFPEKPFLYCRLPLHSSYFCSTTNTTLPTTTTATCYYYYYCYCYCCYSTTTTTTTTTATATTVTTTAANYYCYFYCYYYYYYCCYSTTTTTTLRIWSSGMFPTRINLELWTWIVGKTHRTGDQPCRKTTTCKGHRSNRRNADKHPCFEWDSILRSECLSGRKRFMSRTAPPLVRQIVIKECVMYF